MEGAAPWNSRQPKRPMTPKPRESHLLVHQIEDELVIYDKSRKQAHRLNTTAAKVWSLLDGRRTTAEIAAELDVDESVVALSVDDLASAHLLQSVEPLSISRRTALGRVASAAAIGFLLPAVTSIAAPFAAQAQSADDKDKDKDKDKDNNGTNPPGQEPDPPGPPNPPPPDDPPENPPPDDPPPDGDR